MLYYPSRNEWWLSLTAAWLYLITGASSSAKPVHICENVGMCNIVQKNDETGKVKAHI